MAFLLRFWYNGGTKIISLALLVAALDAVAFDSADWLGQRELFAREAERLRGAYAKCAGSLASPAENVTIPIETYSDGSVKTLVKAARAQFFLQEGLVWGEDVEVRRLSTNGVVEAAIDAKACVVDRATRSGWAEGAAKVTNGKTVFSGEGVYFSSSDSYVKVFGASSFASEEIRFGADGADASGPVRGRSRTSDFDAKSGVALFEGDVVVTSSTNVTLCADRLFMFLRGTNELSRVVAVGSVSVTNGFRSGTCATAVYRRAKDEVELFGDAGAPAVLRERGATARSLEGAAIRFWLASEQVEVEKARIVADAARGKELL